MPLDTVLLWLHLVTGVFLVGYALFWVIVSAPLEDRPDAEGPRSMRALLDELRNAQWPPFGPVRLRLPHLGWLGLFGMLATGLLMLRNVASPPHAKYLAVALAALAHIPLARRPNRGHAIRFLALLLVAIAFAVSGRPTYRATLLSLHLFAIVLWLGHMFFWSFVVGPLCKRYEPAERRDEIRHASHRWGALGGGALLVLALTGTMMLVDRGGDVPGVFHAKLTLVGGMVVYQMVVGHRRAPRLIYLNMLAALVILFLSIVLVHGVR